MAVWVVQAGYAGDEEETALDNNVVTHHWNEFRDLSGIESQDELANLYRKVNPDAKPGSVGMCAAIIWAFQSKIQNSDLVILPLKKLDKLFLAIGEVTGPYAYRTDLGREVHHTRPVQWFIADMPRRRLPEELSKTLDRPPTAYQIINPPDAEESFRAIMRQEIDRRYRLIWKKAPAVETNIIHDTSIYPVKLDSLPRVGELLRLKPTGTAERLYLRVDCVVHNIAVDGNGRHVVNLYVSGQPFPYPDAIPAEAKLPLPEGQGTPAGSATDPEGRYWAEDAERVNSLGEQARQMGITCPCPVTPEEIIGETESNTGGTVPTKTAPAKRLPEDK